MFCLFIRNEFVAEALKSELNKPIGGKVNDTSQVEAFKLIK